MKKYAYFALTLVLTAALLVGCGCTNQNMDNTSEPTVLPTNEEIWDTTQSTTRATTEATTMPTTDTTDATNGTGAGSGMGNGNGAMTDETGNATTATESTGAIEGRARRMIPGSNG